MLIYGNVFLSVLYLLITINYIALLNIPEKGFKKSARLLVLITILFHGALFIYVGFTEGRLALFTVFEVLSMLSLLMLLMLISLEVKTGEFSLGAFILPLAFCFQAISLMGNRISLLDDSVLPMPLFTFHLLTTVVGYACFIYSFILSVMYLYLLKRFKNKKYDKFFFGLPPLDLLEKMNIIILFSGFILLSLGLFSGAWLSQVVWGSIPLLDPKIFLTICLWVIYLLSLMARKFFKLRGKTMSYASIAGFFLIVIIIMLESLTQATLHRF